MGVVSLKSRAEVFEAVQSGILELQDDLAPDQVVETARLVEDLKLDSLAAMELLEILQDKYDVDVPTEALDNVKTVGDVVDAVLKYVVGGE